MEPDRWQRIEALFHRTVELPGDERSRLLASECREDDELRAEVERLLSLDARASAVLDTPGQAVGVTAGDSRIGTELGAFRLTRQIGAGGMGVVYMAERADGLFEQRVAVKLIRAGAATAEVRARFERERRLLAVLEHPNIARLLDGGTTPEGEPYLVMELVEGLPIDRHADLRRASIEDRLRLFVEVCRGVHHAHTNLVIHRDLKPANVLVNGNGVPKLLDFGIARLLDPSLGDAEQLTRTANPLLTPEYASPEQLSGAAVTTASDVYSLGVILYGLLTGQKPFRMDSGSPAAWERIVSGRPPTRPSTAVSGERVPASPASSRPATPEQFAERCATTPAKLRYRLKGDLDRVVLMALRKEPERRYASASAFADDIERHLLGHPVVAREDTLRYRVSKFVHRNRLAVGAATLVLLSLLYGLLAAKYGERVASRQAHHARVEAMSFRDIADFLMAECLGVLEIGDSERKGLMLSRIVREGETVRRKHADDPHLCANLLDALGRACSRVGSFDEARALYDEAYGLRLKEFGPDSLEVALSFGSLGELHYLRGEYGEATVDLERALELHRRHPGETHTAVGLAANDLGAALRQIGELDRAEALHREALELRRAGGARTAAVAESLNNLAGVHLDLGHHARARELLTEAYDIRVELLGEGHGLSLQSLSNLANASWREGDRELGRAQFERCVAGYRELRSQGLEGLSAVLSSVASLDLTAGDLQAAGERLREAYAIRVDLMGPDHPTVALMVAKLARWHGSRGDRDDALAMWEDAVAVLRRADPPSPKHLGGTLQQYGVYLVEIGEYEHAEGALGEALDVFAMMEPPADGEIGRSEACLGFCLSAAGRRTEAVEHLRAGLELMRGAPGVDERELARAQGWLDAVSSGGDGVRGEDD